MSSSCPTALPRCGMYSARRCGLVSPRAGGVVPLRASASTATVTTAFDEGTVKAVTTSGYQRQNLHHVTLEERDLTLGVASSGLDFIDLVGLDDSTVMNRRQDAVTYRVLVGGDVPTASNSAPFNLKQLKSYRDNVTRNLAPTVAWGFANAARAAGHTIGAKPSVKPAATAQPQAQPLRACQSSAGNGSIAAAVAAAAAAAASRVSTTSLRTGTATANPQHHAQAQVTMSYAASSSPAIATGCVEYRRCTTPPHPPGPPGAAAATATAAALPATAAVVDSPVTKAPRSGTVASASSPPASSEMQLRVVRDATENVGALTAGGLGLGLGGSGGPRHEESVWGLMAVAGRRRGSRGSDRGSLLVGAGRQDGVASPTWI